MIIIALNKACIMKLARVDTQMASYVALHCIDTIYTSVILLDFEVPV